MKLEAVTLEGKFVRLEPLNKKHREGLCEAIADGDLWNLYVTLVPPLDQIDLFFENAKTAFETGDGLAFATIDKSTGKVAGSTRFMKANLPNKRLEIGFTFLGKTWQKTSINTEAKLLMLTHAFEVMNLNRVEFLTDYFNSTSRNAILRLGAKEEGMLRSHMIMPNGRVRDSMLYSIVKHEWGGVKLHLNYKLAAR